jgi:hypothetical protein
MVKTTLLYGRLSSPLDELVGASRQGSLEVACAGAQVGLTVRQLDAAHWIEIRVDRAELLEALGVAEGEDEAA